MPLSSLLFRRRPDTASSNKPPQQLMHRSLPPPPPPLPSSPLLPAPALTQKPLLGLKTAIADARILGEEEHRCVKRGSALSSSPSARSFSSSASSSMSSTPSVDAGRDLGAGLDRRDDENDHDEEDHAGEEEEDDYDDEEDERCCWASYGRRSGVRRRLPPPITVLAKAGGRRCLSPWVLRRSYEDGGRLVMREVKVEHQEYLKPCRAGGRLILKLFHLQEPETPGTSQLSAGTQANPPAAPVAVPASTPQNHRGGIPTQAIQSPILKLPRSSSEKEGRTENPPRSAWGPAWSREDDVAEDVQRRRGALRLVTLSSSLPEASTTKGCYVNVRPDSLFGMLAAARIPPVHS